MKISKLKIQNIKCFKEVEISFETETPESKNWSLIVGDNGQGKTTLLRCIALGLCDASGAAGLITDLHEGMLRKDEKEGSIEITLRDSTQQKYKIKTTIKLNGNNEIVSQEISDGTSNELNESSIREQIFTIGYGPGRFPTGTESYGEYAVVDALYTLFNYKYPLQNAELGIRRLNSQNQTELIKSLKEILMFDPETNIYLSEKGMYIKHPQWGDISFNSLSDGYQSLTTVIVDFLSWRLLHDNKEFNLKNTSGIFIIDELEQHLHPKWQRRIIKLLAEQFPKMQFIASTHSSICALGLNDLKYPSQLLKASYKNHYSDHSEVKSYDMKKVYKGYRADQILTSEIFGLKDTRSLAIEETLEGYRKIYLKDENQRTPQENKKLKEIEEELKNLPIWDTIQNAKIMESIQKKLGIQNDKN